jgi:adenine-specific DNA-methyltransferase
MSFKGYINASKAFRSQQKRTIMEKMKMETKNWTSENIEKIGELFPNVITEARGEDGQLKKAINFEALRQVLSEDLLEGDEAFEFTWVGKKAAMVEAGKPIRKTLRPSREESKNWDTTENLYIEGDNLDVLKLLQESYLGKVKMIYIDPPYNTGNDFIYNDRFEMDKGDYQEQIDLFDEDENKNFKLNTDSNPRFHSDWCSMIYSRLNISRSFLSDDGAIFISIDENEVANLWNICNEVFGEDNYINLITVKMSELKGFKMRGVNKKYPKIKEYLLIFAKNKASYFQVVDKIEKPNIIEYSRYYNKKIANMDEPVEQWFIKPIGTKEDKLEIANRAIYLVSRDGDLRRKVDCKVGHFYKFFNADNEEEILYNENGILKKVLFLEDNRFNFIGDIWLDISTINLNKENCSLNYFQNGQKPLSLISRILRSITNEDSVIMDFFSGSATTAHAVMQLNAEDGGKRKFIMVQLPEVTAPDSEAYKAGYKNICEIGKERIRRAGEKIKAEIESNTAQLKLGEEPTHVPDIGFRVLKLDESNMKDVYYIPGAYSQTILESLESNIKADRSDLDLLFGCLLEWGLPLSMPYTSEQIDGFAVHTYNEGDLIACFDENISEKAIKEIAKRQPLRVVFRDSSFASSPEKINVEEIFKLLAPNTSVRVL